MIEITLKHKVGVLRREIATRKRVYPRRVALRLMSQPLADYELATMQAILDDYEKQMFEVEAQDTLNRLNL
jgi:hypothetical protein